MKDVLHLSSPPACRTLPLLLLAIPALLSLVAVVWAERAGFAVAGWAYGGLALLTVLLWAAGYFYQTRRGAPDLAAMLFGTSFLTGFSAAASVLNAMLLTVAGARIDDLLAQADRALGLDWPGMMQLMAEHPAALAVLEPIYASVLPQVALAVIVLGMLGRIDDVYRFVLAIALGALICIFVWTLFPAFGAMSVYSFDPATVARLHVPVDGAYGEDLVRMLREGPGRITPDNLKGLIGFPSYHAVMALVLMRYLGVVPWLKWFVFAINGLVLLSTPIEGGHHFVDVFAAIPVAVLAVMGARWLVHLTRRLDRALDASRLPPEDSLVAG
jgi:hypothetical protein